MAHTARRGPRAPRAPRTLWAGVLAVVLGLSGSLIASPAIAAPGDPFPAGSPVVFVGQDVPTRLYVAAQGAGTITFQPEGTTTGMIAYNAMGFNTNDRYVYAMRRDNGDRDLIRIGQGGVITTLGPVTGLPDIPGANYYNQGSFGSGATSNILYVRGSTANAQLYAVNVTTRTATLVTLDRTVPNLSDLFFRDGFLWGLHSDDVMYRINPTTGVVSSWATGLGINRSFGAQWVYGNGNVGVLANDTGNVHQIVMTGATTATPAFTLLSTAAGPASANNDGTAVPGADVDLGIVKTGPAKYTHGGAISYGLTVTNHGPGASSGSTVIDPLPAGLTGATTSTPGCSIAAGALRCVLAPLAAAATVGITVTATVASGTSGVLTNTATVTGNERDPNPANDRSTVTTQPPGPFSCAPGVVYGLDTSGAILAIDTASGSSVREGFFPAGATALMNSLALTADGRFAFAVRQSGSPKSVYRYDTVTGLATTVGAVPDPGVNLFIGAINPVNGLYYVGGVSGAEYVFTAFNTVTNTPVGVQFRLPTPPGSGFNGDLVFDSRGRAFVVMSSGVGATGNQLVVVENVPTDGSVASARVLTNLAPSTAQFQGVAFGGDGYLYLQYTSATRVLTRNDPNSGAVVSSQTILNPDGSNNAAVSDLSSCALNSTLTLRKDIVGRYGAGDQFTVSITGSGVTQGNAGTTSGSSTGVQSAASATAGPVIGVPGRTYTITETPAGTTDVSNYTTGWECVDVSADRVVIASGTGRTGTVTIPAATPSGSHVECVFTNTPIPTWEIGKQALRDGDVLPDGALVHPGQTLTYRVLATNTSAVAVPGAVLTDDLTDVLDDAAFVPGSAELTLGTTTTVADPAGGILETDPFTLPVGATATLTYDVVVEDDAWSTTLRNVVSGSAGTAATPVDPLCPLSCTTTQVTPTPLQVQKVGEDSAGAIVAMDGSEWSVYSASTGGIPVVASLAAAVSGGAPVTGLFRDTSLAPGTYWLEETRALDGFALLAQRVGFTLAADGTVTLLSGAPSTVDVTSVDGVASIRVQDVPAFDLPNAGGPGTAVFGVVGALLTGVALVLLLATRRRRRGIRFRR